MSAAVAPQAFWGLYDMVQSKKKAGRPDFTVVKDFCSRSSDEDLRLLADLLPQTIGLDRSAACSVLEKDENIDKWLKQIPTSDELFARVDAIGDIAAEELQSRSKKR